MNTKRAIGEVFGFFLSLGRKTGKTRVFALLGLVPVILAVVVRVVLHGRTGDMAAVFTEILMVFFLQFYVVILALFYGTSVVAKRSKAGPCPTSSPGRFRSRPSSSANTPPTRS